MKFAQFETGDGVQRLGILIGERIVDIAELAGAVKNGGMEVAEWILSTDDIYDVIDRGDEGLNSSADLITNVDAIDSEFAFLPDEVELLPPVFPGKMLAIGRNYADHALEGGEPPPPAPLIFNKLTNSLTAHNAPVTLPAI